MLRYIGIHNACVLSSNVQRRLNETFHFEKETTSQSLKKKKKKKRRLNHPNKYVSQQAKEKKNLKDTKTSLNFETEQIEQRTTPITGSIVARISSLFLFLLSLQAQNAVVHHLPTSLSSPFQSFHPMLLPSTLLFSHRAIPAWVYQAAGQ